MPVFCSLVAEDLSMPKKRATRSDAKSKSEAPNPSSDVGAFQALGKRIDEIPTVQSAEEMVRKAQAELANAQEHYQQVRSEAVEQLRDLRQASVSVLTASALNFVRRNPGQGIILSALLGLFLGRLFRR